MFTHNYTFNLYYIICLNLIICSTLIICYGSNIGKFEIYLCKFLERGLDKYVNFLRLNHRFATMVVEVRHAYILKFDYMFKLNVMFTPGYMFTPDYIF